MPRGSRKADWAMANLLFRNPVPLARMTEVVTLGALQLLCLWERKTRTASLPPAVSPHCH